MINKDKQNPSADNSIRDSILGREKLAGDSGTIREKDPIEGRENSNCMNMQNCDPENYQSAKKIFKPTNISK